MLLQFGIVLQDNHFEDTVQECSVEAATISTSFPVVGVLFGHMLDFDEKGLVPSVLNLQEINRLAVADQW